MSMSRSIRQIHRWLSVFFTVAVVVTAIALSQENSLVWVSYIPLFPLALLFLTGLYLFVLPYINKSRGRRANSE